MKILRLLRKRYIFYLLPAFLYFGCGSRDVYNEYVPVNQQGWHADSVYVFNCHVSDSVSSLDTWINIRHTGDYPYRDLTLMIQRILPDSLTETDTVRLILAQKTGKWSGAGSASLRHYKFLYKEKEVFSKIFDYQLKIKHLMQDTLLSGISNAGIRISYSD